MACTVPLSSSGSESVNTLCHFFGVLPCFPLVVLLGLHVVTSSSSLLSFSLLLSSNTRFRVSRERRVIENPSELLLLNAIERVSLLVKSNDDASLEGVAGAEMSTLVLFLHSSPEDSPASITTIRLAAALVCRLVTGGLVAFVEISELLVPELLANLPNVFLVLCTTAPSWKDARKSKACISKKDCSSVVIL